MLWAKLNQVPELGPGPGPQTRNVDYSTLGAKPCGKNRQEHDNK